MQFYQQFLPSFSQQYGYLYILIINQLIYIIMQTNLTTLHNQFQQKHLQLSKITDKIDSFMQIYKAKANGSNKNIKEKVQNLRKEVQEVKSQFGILKKDLITYGQLPNDFIKMVVELPKIYEEFWEYREQELSREFNIKQQQFQLLKQKLAKKEQQNQELKLKLQALQTKKTSAKNQWGKHHYEGLLEAKKISPKLTKVEDSFDSYLQNMEITIRESDDQLFKRITQQGSKEGQDSYRPSLNTARPSILCDISQEFNRAESKDKKFQPNITLQLRKQANTKISKKNIHKSQEQSNKIHCWNKFTKYIDPKSKNSKSKLKNSLSQSKQNIIFGESQENNKLSTAEKKVLTSKISDFRRMLFMEKGIQKIGLKIQNLT